MVPVFNLTGNHISFHGLTIEPGGHISLPDNTFFPDRDRKLETDGIIAIGSMPAWYILKQPVMAPEPSLPPIRLEIGPGIVNMASAHKIELVSEEPAIELKAEPRKKK